MPIPGATHDRHIRQLCPAAGQHDAWPSTTSYGDCYGDGNTTQPDLGSAGTGIYGASYTVAAGIYKNLGYLPAGYDGVDNSTGDGVGLVDEWDEGVDQSRHLRRLVLRHAPRATTRTPPPGRRCSTPSWSRGAGRWARSSAATISPTRKFRTPTTTACPSSSTPGASRSSSSAGRFSTIPTSSAARSSSRPPRGADLDAQPPLTISVVLETREQDPLDPNQQLMAPAWWSIRNRRIAANS